MNGANGCDQTRERIGALVDGELAGRERLAVEQHMDGCAACRRHRDALIELKARIAGMELAEPRALRIWQGIDEELRARPPWTRWVAGLRAGDLRAVAALLLVAAGLALGYGYAALRRGAPESGIEPRQPPPIALTVGDYVDQATAGTPEAFWARYTAIDAPPDALPDVLTDSLEFRPRVRRSLPGGYELRAVKLLKDACCYTIQLRYESERGVLDVFQCHDDHPVTYGRARAQRRVHAGLQYTSLDWDGTPLQGRAFSTDGVSVVLVGALEPGLADQILEDLGQEGVLPAAFEARPLPGDYTGTKLDGTPFAGSELHGKLVLLDFWAVWCAPCIAAVPELNRLQRELGGEDFEVVGFAVHSGDLDRVAAAARELEMQYRVVAGDEDVVYDYDVLGYPTYLLLDRQGRLVRKYVGALPDLEQRVAADVRALTAAPR